MRQNRTLRDALRNVPGISLAAGEAGAQGDNLTIRGFTARNDIFLDGIRDFGSYYRDSFNYEQVEVLEGPAGVQFGRGSTGGVINQESKVPPAQQVRECGDAVWHGPDAAGDGGHQRAAAGCGGGHGVPAECDGDGGGRCGAAVCGEPAVWARAFGEFGMNSPTRLTVSYFHFTESDTPDYGLPWFLQWLAPGAIRHNYYGFPDAELSEDE